MQQFINESDSAYAELEARATGRCILFRNQQMPPSSTPRRADVGFEVDPDTRAAILCVQYGVDYHGPDRELFSWFQEGEKRFQSFRQLRDWIRIHLAPAYSTASLSAEAKGPGQLTDIRAVRNSVRGVNQPLFLDEDKLLAELSRPIRGQSTALRPLARLVCRHCARIRPSRPGVVLAVGPTGVGKTYTGECLAKVLRRSESGDNGYGYVRLDMSEYQESHRVSQLIGSPQGYVGYGEGSQLIDKLIANPRTVVLFDEIEKAHPAILRTLMNAMDAGRLSTAAKANGGREVDCRYAIFIFTSSLGSEGILTELQDRNGFGESEVEDEVCRRHLRASGMAPEIIGRIGRFLVFRPLTPEDRAEITALAIAEVAAEYGLRLERIAPSVVVSVLEKVRTDNFGVRPVRYLIDELLGGVFAEAAAGQIRDFVEVLGPPFRCTPVQNPAREGSSGSAATTSGDNKRG